MTARYSDLLWDGSPPRYPVLHLDDTSAIPFLVDIAGVEEYQHRARLRAGDGDLFAAVTPDTPGFEDYCAERLGLGSPELLISEPTDGWLRVARACADGASFARLVDTARAAGGLVIHPYMGNEDVWRLARMLADAAGTPISVIGPPPPITWIANDKARFNEVVERTLGREWIIETYPLVDPGEMAATLRALAVRYARVGLKRTRCASAMGNEVYDSAKLLATDVEATVRAFLTRTEWPGDEEVLVVPWEETELSPSTQLWIPPAGSGAPRLDGIYEQLLEGPERVFVGSRPTTMPTAVNDALASAALRVAGALQELGYIGRCSFDHLVIGDPHGAFRACFTECNGRWGGTSTPMSLLDRVLAGAPRPPYRAQDFVREQLVGAAFRDILECVGDQAFDARTRSGRFLFYNVGPLANSGKLDVIALGETQAHAEAALLEDLPRLLRV